ncbi:putative dimethylaniline monooxygenase 2 [Rosellinia necatrix]|uniref:Putative dimethylaniline monooxygenase 2 n=1 Tax=Rosellinia necatrix TaxID=77044 RepID=A0A1W2TBU7_ROSNE|nr:putative dimethylaniline monooxygenase 2 [Rosellinia necatrix]
MDKVRIAVIGGGPAGLTALKTLREEGFDAVVFERRNEIGGLWVFADDASYTSVLRETMCNGSSFISGFSDFPMPKEYPAYITAYQVLDFFKSYASHFNLLPHVRLGIIVQKVIRNAADDAWDVHIIDSDGVAAVLSFDKVVFAHGRETLPLWPDMPNRDKFKGTVLHGQAFKSPEPFKGKRVLVVGFGTTACETSLILLKHASKVYLSYRRGRILMPRYHDDGVPLDTKFSWPLLRLKYVLDTLVPGLVHPAADKFILNQIISTAVKHEPVEDGISAKERRKRTKKRVLDDWRLGQAPSLAYVHPVVEPENLIPALRRGDITPVYGFKEFAGASEVLLSDGSVLEVDVVIFCTGYEMDFSIMPELEMDGAFGHPLRTAGELSKEGIWHGARDAQSQPHIPRLYQMMFPPRYASSVAIISWMSPQENMWCAAELASMAVAQIWAAEVAAGSTDANRQHTVNNYRPSALLPSLEEMNAQVDAYQTWWWTQWKSDHSMGDGHVQSHSLQRFLHQAAGTGLYDNFGHIFTTRWWSLWWSDRELWRWLSSSPMNSYSWRLFDTNPKGVPGCGRKTWPEARQAMKDAHENYQDYYKKQVQNKSV